MANRLAHSLSPYLRQHADQSVDWWEWGDDAFAEARRRDVPVLLSIGYSACHWCHVMSHESFEDDQVAALLNTSFVAIKVDREERPDVDAVYMAATTALTGHGGWPMTCILTPDGAPFYAGTYYPKGQFIGLLEAVNDSWRHQREDIEGSARRITDALAQIRAQEADGASAGGYTEADLSACEQHMVGYHDWAHGGFGSAPKFPPSMVLEWLLRRYARTGSADALHIVEITAQAMARRGLYDQIAGGFARYSVDATWVVPHFEKMLYDNAQLLSVYCLWHEATGSRLAGRIATETADFLLRELRTSQGAFASALDADTVVDDPTTGRRNVEGATYLWTRDQLVEILGSVDGARAAALLSVTTKGTFGEGFSTLQLLDDPGDPQWWQRVRTALWDSRRRRPQPARDDKVVASWNGLAISALVRAARVLNRPELLAAAQACADHVLSLHRTEDGRLRRVSLHGTVGSSGGCADDYGNVAAGLLALHEATMDPRPLRTAGELLDTALSLLRAEDGGCYDIPAGADLSVRPRSATDNAEPSGQSCLAGALLDYGTRVGSPAHLRAADEILAATSGVGRSHPRFAGWGLAITEARLAGPVQVTVVYPGEVPDEAARSLLAVAHGARARHSPGLLVTHGRPDAPGIPLLADRPCRDGQATAYVCVGTSCGAPLTDPQELATVLAGAEPVPPA